MKLNHRKLIREARELLDVLPDSPTRAALGVLVMQWNDEKARAEIDGAELLVAVLDGREELREARREVA